MPAPAPPAFAPAFSNGYLPRSSICGVERALLAVAGAVAFVAASALALAVSGYVEVEPVPACPGAQEAGRLCVTSAFDGRAYAAAFDSESFEAQDASALLAGTLAASAAILAISFTVNQVVLSSVSQRYSSGLVESYAKKPAASFAAFVLTVAGSAALLLVHNSPHAWIGAYFVWALAAGFFAALCFFAWEFTRMVRVVSPYSFVEDAKKRILAGIKGPKGAPARPLSEVQFERLARSLGDAAVKSLASSDEDVCIACVEALGDVGKAGLSDTGSAGKGAAEMTLGELADKTRACFAAGVLARIFRDSARTENSPVTGRILKKLSEMAAWAMRYKGNEIAVGFLYDKALAKGSLNWQAVERLAGSGGRYDKSNAIRHLGALPRTAATADWHMPHVEQFVRYHVFRSVVAIIDKGDFEMFKEVIDVFSLGFGHMEGMKSSITDQVFRICEGRPDLAARRDEILFELEHATKRDFGAILELKQEIWDLLAQADPDTGADRNGARGMSQLYVYSLLCGTFFRIACHIIGKGDERVAYLRELWRRADSGGRPDASAGAPPCPKDVDWNSAYSVWRGQRGLAQIEIADDPGTYEPHYHEYAVLHMLREGRIFTVPGEKDAAKWASRGHHYALEYHYEAMDGIKAEPFLEALDFLAGSKLPAEMLPADAQARIDGVREKLRRYKDDRRRLMDELVCRMPVDGQKISEWKGMAREAYSENSQAGTMGRVRYDAGLRGGIVAVPDSMPIRALCRKGYTALDGQIGVAVAKAEFERILEKAGDGATRILADPGGLEDSVRACVGQMRKDGHDPRVALVPRRHREQMPETYSTNSIDAGGQPIPIAKIPWNIPDTWILDPDCLEITYGAENEAGRMRPDVQDTENGKVPMTSSIRLSVRVLDGGGIARIAFGDA